MGFLSYLKEVRFQRKCAETENLGGEPAKETFEYTHPAVISQSSSDSIITSDGRYDMTRLSAEEERVVRSVIRIAKSGKYPEEAQGIGLANEAYSIIYKPRYILHEIIIQKYADSNNPLDMLAVAAAYKTKGSYGRTQAIRYYELWLSRRDEYYQKIAESFFFDAREPFFSYNLAQLYMQEYRLDEALRFAFIAEQHNTEHAPGFPLLIAEIYRKKDISQCIDYLKKTVSSKEYAFCKAMLELELQKAIELQGKEYVYRPRKESQVQKI